MNKQQILALQGVPASGKSTWAQQYSKDNPGWVIVSRDIIRKGFSDEWSPKLEKTVIDMEDSMIRNAVESGYSVIVDDTNLNPLTIKHLEDLAGELNLE
ncbi:MAG: AAA family ATPase, partial [Parabacteroides sp.]|nr:AAA family ATPase [Parabacteroides sp.]